MVRRLDPVRLFRQVDIRVSELLDPVNKFLQEIEIQEGMEEIGRVAVPDSKHGFGALENSLDVSFTDRLVRIQWNITQVFGD